MLLQVATSVFFRNCLPFSLYFMPKTMKKWQIFEKVSPRNRVYLPKSLSKCNQVNGYSKPKSNLIRKKFLFDSIVYILLILRRKTLKKEGIFNFLFVWGARKWVRTVFLWSNLFFPKTFWVLIGRHEACFFIFFF